MLQSQVTKTLISLPYIIKWLKCSDKAYTMQYGVTTTFGPHMHSSTHFSRPWLEGLWVHSGHPMHTMQYQLRLAKYLCNSPYKFLCTIELCVFGLDFNRANKQNWFYHYILPAAPVSRPQSSISPTWGKFPSGGKFYDSRG